LAEHSLPDQMVDKIKATRSKLSLKNLFARAA
jgi:hypothetical protein